MDGQYFAKNAENDDEKESGAQRKDVLTAISALYDKEGVTPDGVFATQQKTHDNEMASQKEIVSELKKDRKELQRRLRKRNRSRSRNKSRSRIKSKLR